MLSSVQIFDLLYLVVLIMSLRGRQRRNRSCINGRKAHCYEYYYHGPYSSDLIVTADIYVSANSDHYCCDGPLPCSRLYVTL